MEWARETAKDATSAVLKPVTDPSGTANAAKETAKELPGSDTASAAYDTASDYVPSTGGKGSSTTTASIINTPPFSSFKPDPSTVWIGYIIYVLLSAACTIPWWTFVTAADYFQHLYPASHIIRYFTLAYFVSWLIVYLLFSRFGREGTSWIKINLGLTVAVLALASIPLMDGVFIKGEEGTSATFWVTLVAVALAGGADAVAQGSLLGISAELPETFTHAYVIGAVASGVFALIVRVITKASLNSSASGLRIGAIIYFSIVAFVIVLVMALFAYIHYMPEMGYYNSLNLGSFETVRLLLQDEDSVSPEVAAGAAIAAVAAGRSSPAQPLTWRPVLNRIKLLAVAVGITSLVSLTIFPGYLTEDVKSTYFGSWYSLLLVGTYVVFDLVGRISTSCALPERHAGLFGLAWARLLLLGFFLLALVGPRYGVSQVLFLLTAVLGFSNGYLIAALTILIPRANPANEAEPAGILHAAIMNAGTILGTGLSWIWVLLS